MVTVYDPWGFGNSLEWATSCPPPLRNFDQLPRIRSERPAFDAKYGPLVSDLGRDLHQRATKLPQDLDREHHPDEDRHGEGADAPSAEGAHGAAAAEQFKPDPRLGARPVEVPEPQEVRRPQYPPAEPDDTAGTPDRGGEENKRWRTTE
jgi:cytochrome c oxidase subunit I